MSHYLIIANPHAGSADIPFLKLCIERLLPTDSYTLVVEDSERAALEMTLAHIKTNPHIDTLIVCGGDGTLQTALDIYASNQKLIIGLIPLGTGNLLAKMLNIPETIPEALKIITEGYTRQLNPAHLNNTPFFISAGIGFDADVMQKTNKNIKREIGILAYVLKGFSVIDTDLNYDVILEGEITSGKLDNLYEGLCSGIMFIQHFDVQNIFGLFSKEETLKPHLDALVLLPGFSEDLLTIFYHVMRGTIDEIDSPYFLYFESTHFNISSLKSIPIQADGNIITIASEAHTPHVDTQFRVQSSRTSFPILCPENTHNLQAVIDDTFSSFKKIVDSI